MNHENGEPCECQILDPCPSCGGEVDHGGMWSSDNIEWTIDLWCVACDEVAYTVPGPPYEHECECDCHLTLADRLDDALADAIDNQYGYAMIATGEMFL
jgi:hypothetical protein